MRNVLIVNASHGIGLGPADAFLQCGTQVLAVARRPQGSPGLQTLAERVEERLQAVTGDLNRCDCTEHTGEALGERRIGRLIANAGIYGLQQQDMAETDAEQITQLFLADAIAPLHPAKTLSGQVNRDGVMTFTSSQVASLTLGLSAIMPLYGASEAAPNSLVRSWEGEFEELPFSLLLLRPGWVRTEMGGDDALLSVEGSAAGLVTTIEDAADVNACHLVDYRDQPLPW